MGKPEMESIKDAAAEYLTHQRVAVTGVSRNAGSHGSNAVYQRLRQRGYQATRSTRTPNR